MAAHVYMSCYVEKAGKLTIRKLSESIKKMRFKRPKRRVSAEHRCNQVELSNINECWSMDFVADQLFNGRRLRPLTIVDNFSRECLSITVDHGLRGGDVVAAMDAIYQQTGRKPERIKVDNGSEFVSRVFDKWAYSQ